jgi:hypothetical protein
VSNTFARARYLRRQSNVVGTLRDWLARWSLVFKWRRLSIYDYDPRLIITAPIAIELSLSTFTLETTHPWVRAPTSTWCVV